MIVILVSGRSAHRVLYTIGGRLQALRRAKDAARSTFRHVLRSTMM
jgi:hypothetical protein